MKLQEEETWKQTLENAAALTASNEESVDSRDTSTPERIYDNSIQLFTDQGINGKVSNGPLHPTQI